MNSPGTSRPSSIPFNRRLLRAREWQHRPEFEQLCSWWRAGGYGVCALVGMGGAGKTAIAERFLQILPGAFPAHPKVSKDSSLVVPHRLFVFSFYDVPNPDSFIQELAIWLGFQPNNQQPIPSFQQLLDLLSITSKCLLVLDGMEKIQNDNMSGGAFGQILDSRMKDLVLSIADGWLSQVSMLITSRFPLYDPQAERTEYYQQIDINRLQSSAAINLLRARGVIYGTDEDLLHLASEQGFHALTVDLMGGYIAYFCDGDPSRLPPDPFDLPEVLPDDGIDPVLKAIRDQERRLTRLTQRYQSTMEQNDPAALALLQRVCLFRLGMDVHTLAAIFIGEDKVNGSGNDLASLTLTQFKQKLNLLSEMRLLETQESQMATMTNAIGANKQHVKKQRSKSYSIHPAVRDGFLRGLDMTSARAGHDAVRQELEISLGHLPQSYSRPSDVVTLDLMEEIIYHTVEAGYIEEGFEIYDSRMGGFTHLFNVLTLYERGERICRMFLNKMGSLDRKILKMELINTGLVTSDFGLSPDTIGQLIFDWSRCLGELGRLGDARSSREYALSIFIRTDQWKKILEVQGELSKLMISQGRLPEARQLLLTTFEDVMTIEKLETGSVYDRMPNYLVAWAEIDFALGDIGRALANMNQARSLFGPNGAEHASWSESPHMSQYIDLHNIEVANYILESIDHENYHCPRCKTMLWKRLAELSLLQHDTSKAREWLKIFDDWAVKRDAKEELCWAALIQAKLIISEIKNVSPDNPLQDHMRSQCSNVIERGLRITRNCGFGLDHIDLLLVRAQLALHEGLAENALLDIAVALDEGVYADSESDRPNLMAATDESCHYAWGIAKGLHIRGEALLLQAAQAQGSDAFIPARRSELVESVRSLITKAENHLDSAITWWHKLRDPVSNEKMTQHQIETQQVLDDLYSGLLTRYPLEQARPLYQAIAKRSDDMATNNQGNQKPINVFYSYAHEDETLRAKLETHLALLKHQERIANLYDRQIEAGKEWDTEIKQKLDASRIILLLVSSDFIASSYIYDIELKYAMERHQAGDTRVIPIILQPCDWHSAPFGGLMALPTGGEAVTTWGNIESAFADIANGIRSAVTEISGVR